MFWPEAGVARTFLTVSAQSLVRGPCNGQFCPVQGEGSPKIAICASNGQKCPLGIRDCFFLALTDIFDRFFNALSLECHNFRVNVSLTWHTMDITKKRGGYH